MENISAKIEKKTRKVYLSKSVIGNDGENLQEKLVFSFIDEFVNGTARLELNRNNTKSYIMLTKVDNTYELPVKSLITKVGKLDLQLVITEGTNENEIPIFKSNVFFVIVNPSINAEIEEEEDYPQWIDIANTKLNEINEALDDLQDKVDSGYFKGEKGDKGDNGEQGIQGIPGRDGVDGTNGRDGAIQYTAGDNIIIENNVISAINDSSSNIIISNNLNVGAGSTPNNYSDMKKGIYIPKVRVTSFYMRKDENSAYTSLSTDFLIEKLYIIKELSEIEDLTIDNVIGYMDVINTYRGPGKLFYSITLKANGTIQFSDMTNLYYGMYYIDQGSQTFYGKKTFQSVPSCSLVPTSNNDLTNKKYVDDSIASAITTTLNGSY